MDIISLLGFVLFITFILALILFWVVKASINNSELNENIKEILEILKSQNNTKDDQNSNT